MPCSAVYHPGFPLAFDSCEHSWWYISRTGQPRTRRLTAMPPTKVSFSGYSFIVTSFWQFIFSSRQSDLSQSCGIEAVDEILIRHIRERSLRTGVWTLGDSAGDHSVKRDDSKPTFCRKLSSCRQCLSVHSFHIV